MLRKKIMPAFLIAVAATWLQSCGEAADKSLSRSENVAELNASIYSEQPVINTRQKTTISRDNWVFKDLNGNGALDPYEDWRLSTTQRVADLVAQMTLEEKVGMLMIDTLNAGWGGVIPASASDYINTQKMTRFIFRNGITSSPKKLERAGFSGQPLTVRQAAEFTNGVQALAEATRLGIPVVFKSNARNHYERHARAGINTTAGAFSEWPKEAGLAATRDESTWKRFAEVVAEEWRAVGLRAMYGYMADLSTEPRWFRNHESFTEDATLATKIITSLVQNLQGGPVNPQTAVALTVKHFPGGGPQVDGLDPHYTFGKYQHYPAQQFAEHLKPFVGAINAGVSSIMPYYGVPVDLVYDGVRYEQQGMAFSKSIVTDLLRNTLGFSGYVNSDTGIIGSRAWGLEDRSVNERIALAVNAGVDVLSGFHRNNDIAALVSTGQISEQRVDEAVSRLLWEQFQLGLFENPYVDAEQAEAIVGKQSSRDAALQAQRQSVVLLKNQKNLLPLPRPSNAAPINIVTLGLNSTVVADPKYGGYQVTDARQAGALMVPANADYALIRIEVSNPRNVTATYKSADPKTGGRFNPATGKTWGAADTELLPSPLGFDAALDDGLIFGGSAPYEANSLSFTSMAAAETWEISPALADIQKVIDTVGADKTVLAIYFRQPYVLDDDSQLLNAGGLLATFGVSDAALMDVISGKFSPAGKLPFALPKTIHGVLNQAADAPGFAPEDTLYPYGFGLIYGSENPL